MDQLSSSREPSSEFCDSSALMDQYLKQIDEVISSELKTFSDQETHSCSIKTKEQYINKDFNDIDININMSFQNTQNSDQKLFSQIEKQANTNTNNNMVAPVMAVPLPEFTDQNTIQHIQINGFLHGLVENVYINNYINREFFYRNCEFWKVWETIKLNEQNLKTQRFVYSYDMTVFKVQQNGFDKTIFNEVVQKWRGKMWIEENKMSFKIQINDSLNLYEIIIDIYTAIASKIPSANREFLYKLIYVKNVIDFNDYYCGDIQSI